MNPESTFLYNPYCTYQNMNSVYAPVYRSLKYDVFVREFFPYYKNTLQVERRHGTYIRYRRAAYPLHIQRELRMLIYLLQ